MPTQTASRYPGNTSISNLALGVPDAVTLTGDVTLTVAQVVGALYRADTNGSNRAATTPTATAIIGALGPGTTKGASFDFWIHSTGANTITLNGGSGVTIVGTATVATGTARKFTGVVTDTDMLGTPAVSLYAQ